MTKRCLIIAAVLIGGWALGLVHGMLSAAVTPILLKVLLLAGVVAAMATTLRACGEHAFEDARWKVLPLLGAALGVVALWGSWCGWVWAASDFKYFLALHPLDLFDVVRGVTEHAEYTATGRGNTVTVSRSSVRAGWIIEASTIAGGAFLSALFAAFGKDKERWEI